MTTQNELLSPQAVAQMKGVSRETVRRACIAGELPALRRGRDYCIARTDAERWHPRPLRARPETRDPDHLVRIIVRLMERLDHARSLLRHLVGRHGPCSCDACFFLSEVEDVRRM